MGKLRQNSEVTRPRSCNLSVAKPGIYFQKSRSQTSVQLKSLPTTTKQATHATFFPPTAAVVLVTQRKWMIFPDWIPAFFGKKHLVLSKCCIMLFAEAFLLRHNRKKDGFPMAGRLYRSKQSLISCRRPAAWHSSHAVPPSGSSAVLVCWRWVPRVLRGTSLSPGLKVLLLPSILWCGEKHNMRQNSQTFFHSSQKAPSKKALR